MRAAGRGRVAGGAGSPAPHHLVGRRVLRWPRSGDTGRHAAAPGPQLSVQCDVGARRPW